MSAVLVTGGAGFIGSHLVDRLPGPVRVLDDLSTGRRGCVAASAEFIEGSVTDRAALKRALAGVRVVYHLAARVSVPESVENPRRTHEVNVEGTVRLIEEAAAAGARRVVFASSCAIYGDRGEGAIREDAPAEPASPYAVSKLAGEHYGRLARGVEFVSLRFFNVYGPRQDPSSGYAAVVPSFLSALDAGRPLILHGDGGQTRDFVFVGDVVEALIRAAEAPGVHGRVFNVGSGASVSIRELADTAARVAGRPATLDRRPPRAGDLRHSRADTSAAARDLGFRVGIPLDQGLAAAWRGIHGG